MKDVYRFAVVVGFSAIVVGGLLSNASTPEYLVLSGFALLLCFVAMPLIDMLP